MPSGEVGQVLYFDVIKEPAPTLAEWAARNAIELAASSADEQLNQYRHYLALRQPWRAVLLVEGNHEPLFVSSERYFEERHARNAGAMAFGPQATVFERRAEHGLNLLRRGRAATVEEQQV